MNVRRRFGRAIGLCAVIAAAVTLIAGPASAASPPTQIVDGLGGPLQFQVAHDGSILVGQSMAGIVSRVSRHGTVTDLVSDPGQDLSGVAIGAFGSTYFTRTGTDGTAKLRRRDRNGHLHTVADIGAYEATVNPDHVNSYGFQGLSQECSDQLPPDFRQQNGGIESHPYAIANTVFGQFVADAAGNDILFVDLRGRVHTVAVLPPQPLLATPEVVAGQGLPECVTGATYNFDPVPTDVEVGRDGKLYVTTLPGGPEDASLGARGSVYRINPWTGGEHRVATGFLGATNLAISPHGTIFVAELFANQVSKVVAGHPQVVASLPSPAGVEWARGRLYVSTDVFGSGKIVTLQP